MVRSRPAAQAVCLHQLRASGHWTRSGILRADQAFRAVWSSGGVTMSKCAFAMSRPLRRCFAIWHVRNSRTATQEPDPHRHHRLEFDMARHLPRHARSAPRGRRALIALAVLVAGALTAGFVAGPADAATRVLRIGSRGADVLALERRLAGLHYDVGRVDGYYDNSTFHSVLAFQKVNGLARDGIAGPITQGRLAHPAVPRVVVRRAGSYLEINLTRQVMVYARNGGIVRIFDVSTGSGRLYTVNGQVRRAVTPTGNFRIQRKINAWRTSTLGRLYRPAYFYGGYAVHGSWSVPAYPASHGCVRVTIAAMDRLYNGLPIGMPVKVYR
jgi:peptidoglycan hydrolase-like protein with peptidoglycan-binding domain